MNDHLQYFATYRERNLFINLDVSNPEEFLHRQLSSKVGHPLLTENKTSTTSTILSIDNTDMEELKEEEEEGLEGELEVMEEDPLINVQPLPRKQEGNLKISGPHQQSTTPQTPTLPPAPAPAPAHVINDPTTSRRENEKTQTEEPEEEEGDEGEEEQDSTNTTEILYPDQQSKKNLKAVIISSTPQTSTAVNNNGSDLRAGTEQSPHMIEELEEGTETEGDEERTTEKEGKEAVTKILHSEQEENLKVTANSSLPPPPETVLHVPLNPGPPSVKILGEADSHRTTLVTSNTSSGTLENLGEKNIELYINVDKDSNVTSTSSSTMVKKNTEGGGVLLVMDITIEITTKNKATGNIYNAGAGVNVIIIIAMIVFVV